MGYYNFYYDESEHSREINHKTITANNYMSVFVLLATQIKYDVTSVAVSPKYWFEMRLNDFSAKEKEFAKANNQLINELKLNEEFRI